jgi:hypothetical protein
LRATASVGRRQSYDGDGQAGRAEEGDLLDAFTLMKALREPELLDRSFAGRLQPGTGSSPAAGEVSAEVLCDVARGRVGLFDTMVARLWVVLRAGQVKTAR